MPEQVEPPFHPKDLPDLPETDETGNVDLSLLRCQLMLTPAERMERHYHARMLAERLRHAGERYYGSPHPDFEAID